MAEKNLMTKETINKIKVIDSVMRKQQFVEDYLELKKTCVINGIFDMSEIKDLFKQWRKEI